MVFVHLDNIMASSFVKEYSPEKSAGGPFIVLVNNDGTLLPDYEMLNSVLGKCPLKESLSL